MPLNLCYETFINQHECGSVLVTFQLSLVYPVLAIAIIHEHDYNIIIYCYLVMF